MRTTRGTGIGGGFLWLAVSVWGLAAHADDIRIGMIGLDTSHVVAFTKLLNDPSHKQHVPGGKVESVFEGYRADDMAVLGWCYSGPPMAQVERVEVTWEEPSGEFDAFEARW